MDRTSLLFRAGLTAAFVVAAAAGTVFTQSGGGRGRTAANLVRQTGPGLYQVGKITVDTNKKEIALTGHFNPDVTALEFVASTAGGMKAYESAVTVDTDGVTFNTALLLIGVDPSHSRVPKQHFDPMAPKGDPLEIWVEWSNGVSSHKVRIEQLLYDDRTKRTLPEGPWVYTGSTFQDGKYQADIDGVLIGFVHSPAPVIENPRAGAVGAYGSIVMNRHLDFLGGMNLLMTVKALPAKR